MRACDAHGLGNPRVGKQTHWRFHWQRSGTLGFLPLRHWVSMCQRIRDIWWAQRRQHDSAHEKLERKCCKDSLERTMLAWSQRDQIWIQWVELYQCDYRFRAENQQSWHVRYPRSSLDCSRLLARQFLAGDAQHWPLSAFLESGGESFQKHAQRNLWPVQWALPRSHIWKWCLEML